MSWLDETAATIAFLWRIERRDGVTLGFTSHDRDLMVDGLMHRAAPGMVPSAVETRDDLDPGGSEVAGVMTADAIRADDLFAGRWDGAAVTLSACDWTAPDDAIVLSRGTLGAVEAARGGFSAELLGAVAALARPVVEHSSPECRADLGDRRCRVAMAGRRVRAIVTGVEDAVIALDRTEPVADAWGWGRVRWLDGANAGLSDIVHSSDGTQVRLTAAPRFAVTAGTAVEVIEGCDRRFETCRDRFRNAVNFQGEPHLPGMDLLTRYPGVEMEEDSIVSAARALIGTRFRLHGRDARGIDCVGLVARATGRPAITGYPLRGMEPAGAEARLAEAGFRIVADMRAGDVMLIRSGPTQLHLGVRTQDGFVHAHAGLRRVVETPGLPGAILSIWRAD